MNSRITLTLIIIIVLCPASMLYSESVQTQTPTLILAQKLEVGSSGAEVKLLQEYLNSKGITTAVDGKFGPKTKMAVRELQMGLGITADGIVGPKTVAAINQLTVGVTQDVYGSSGIPSAPFVLTGSSLKFGSRGENVANLQRYLQGEELYNGTVDGIFGSQTLQAVIRLQTILGVLPDGAVGLKTEAAIHAYKSNKPNSLVASTLLPKKQLNGQTDNIEDKAMKDLNSDTPEEDSSSALTPASSPALELSGRITLPYPGVAECSGNYRFVLDQCINALLEKTGTSGVEIMIPAGTFILTSDIFLYNRDKVTIRGAGKEATVLRFEIPAKRYWDQCFLFNIVDSNDVAIKDLTIEGGGNSCERAIAVCPVGDESQSNIIIQNTGGRNVAGYYTIMGNAYGELIAKHPLSDHAPQRRFTSDVAELPVDKRYCSGNISNVVFSDNEIELQSVGFYAESHSAKLTPGILVTTENWPQVVDQVADKWTGFRVENNLFKVMSDDVHSAMKFHYMKGTVIRNNTIEAGPFRKVFSKGSAINLGPGMTDTFIEGNIIRFPTNHSYKSQGINIPAGFTQHTEAYGLGTSAISPPARRTIVSGNVLTNAQIRLFDVCLVDQASYCIDSDNSQSADAAKSDGIKIFENIYNGKSADPESLFIISRQGNSSWLRTVFPRKILSVAADVTLPTVATPGMRISMSSVRLPERTVLAGSARAWLGGFTIQETSGLQDAVVTGFTITEKTPEDTPSTFRNLTLICATAECKLSRSTVQPGVVPVGVRDYVFDLEKPLTVPKGGAATFNLLGDIFSSVELGSTGMNKVHHFDVETIHFDKSSLAPSVQKISPLINPITVN